MLIPYASKTTTRRNLAALRAAGWRLLLSPTGCGLDPVGFPYCLDNGAWTFHAQQQPFDHRLFLRALRSVGHAADFVVAPDIVMGGIESLHLSLRYLPRCLRHAPRVLLPVQDGMTVDDLAPWLGERVGIFVGGSSEWKEATMHIWARLCRSKGAWCHVGRVNTGRRIRLCAMAGANSFDGTSASKFSVTLSKLDNHRRQTTLLLED